MSQGSLTNPFSGLPEGALVDERMSEIIQHNGSGILLVAIENMDAFREAYGFVASDDVLRAISLMIVNTMREISGPTDFLGHLSGTDFVLVTPPSNLSALQERLRTRLEQSMDYFYPIKDREQASKRKDRLSVKIAEINSVKGKFSEVDSLKTELLRLKK
jgi:GGDEF domain-containing protein